MVGGNPHGLAKAERELGLDSTAVAFNVNPWGMDSDEVLFTGSENPLSAELKRWRLVGRAVRKFDVVHYNYGSSIIDPSAPKLVDVASRYPAAFRLANRAYRRLAGMRDPWIMRRTGKVVFVTYQGIDARQYDRWREWFDLHDWIDTDQKMLPVSSFLMREGSDDFKRMRIDRFSQQAHRIYALNPDLLRVLPPHARFMAYASVDPREWQPEVNRRSPGSPIRLLHAPSGRDVKGTRYVLNAVEKLQSEGISVELDLVEGVPHDQVRALYNRADILVEQLLCGWYGGLAVELMALAKPVITYIRTDDLQFIPPEMDRDLPIINARPESLYDVIKKLVTVDRDSILDIGRRSRAYVEKWHDPLKIAASLRDDALQVMEERSPSD
jgi:hypothetical protein